MVPQFADTPLFQQILGFVINWVLTLMVWFVCKRKLNSIDSESDAESGEERADEKSAWNHILATAPWIARVGAINLFAQFGVIIDNWTANDPHLGHRFLYFAGLFAIMFTLVWLMSAYWAKLSENGTDLLSLPVFVLDVVNGSLLSTSGKAIHFMVGVLAEGVTGPGAEQVLYKYLWLELIMGVISVFILGYCLPRFSLKTEHDKVSHTVLAYLAIYAWAFSFVDFLWFYFWTYLENFAAYWAFMGFLLVLAIILGVRCGNLYGGPGVNSKTFGNMLCWTVDFGVWWGWCQVMTDMDTWAKGEYGVAGEVIANVLMVAALFAVTALVYVSSSHETMLQHDFERANPVPIEAVAFGRDALNVLKGDAYEVEALTSRS
eukprot:TRINITY_DN39295_c0_g1_i1.p1 TRINITY_DN39295_c0_g1~~TRINITY_DN39295_c0_g1_i1.p1  ORF type:complete len:433 (-),score=84.33 TRINITY_DN39295_c0_g1_i1:154-1281(-)